MEFLAIKVRPCLPTKEQKGCSPGKISLFLLHTHFLHVSSKLNSEEEEKVIFPYQTFPYNQSSNASPLVCVLTELILNYFIYMSIRVFANTLKDNTDSKNKTYLLKWENCLLIFMW